MVIKALLLMGGSGERFGSDLPKQFHRISGKKVYLHTLEKFLKSGLFNEILLVVPEKWIETVQTELPEGPIKTVMGGTTRQHSSYLGLLACGPETNFVVIHDAVRPFVSQKILKENVEAVQIHEAIDTCIPSADTLIHKSQEDEILTIPNRSEYMRGQTPQSFSYPLILKAHLCALGGNASDDCQLILHYVKDKKIKVVYGEESNIKITTELDLFLAEQLFRLQPSPQLLAKKSLKGKKYIITGGTGGIGSALHKILHKEGAEVIVISPSAPQFPADLTNSETARSLFETLGPVDGLINSLGCFQFKEVSALQPLEIEKLIDVNLIGLIFSSKYAQIKEKGHIVNIASSSYSKGRKNYAIYSAAKAAVVNFTQGLAEERLDLCINALIPQRTNTTMRQTHFPHEDPSTLLSPEAVAESILNLLQQDAVTGSIIEVRQR